MKKSLVMATYNGEKYIQEQLQSLLNQTLPLDEVLIFDDGSTDETVKCVQAFISENKLSTWKISQNEKNKGYARNFLDGILQATGEIVFLCDQDDIWLNHKVEIMSEAMENPMIEVLSSNYKPKVAKEMDIKSKVFYQLEYLFQKRNGKEQKVDFEKRGLFSGAPGWTICVRKSFVEEIIPYFTSDFSHDGLLCSFSAARGTYHHINKVTGLFRRYPESTTSYKQKVSTMQRESDLSTLYLNRVLKIQEFLLERNQSSKTLEKQGNYFAQRRTYIQDKSLMKLFGISKYWSKVNNIWAIKDLFYFVNLL